MAWRLHRASVDDARGEVPREVWSYAAWCEARGLEPYPAIPSTADDYDRCCAQERAWADERQAYRARHPFVVLGQPVDEQLPRDYWNPGGL